MRTRWQLTVLAVLSIATACGGGSGDKPDGNTGGADTGSNPLPQCSDGIDNDGDGLIDYPNDPGCVSPNQNSETDDCPDGPNCPQCGNHKDDDGNGLIDFSGGDPGCTSAADTTEMSVNPSVCGGSTMVIPLSATGGSADGMLDGTSTTQLTNPCGDTTHASAYAYEIVLTANQVIVATTDNGDTTVDTVLDIRGSDCADGSAEIACDDNTPGADSSVVTSTVTAAVTPGTYYILVEGFDQTVTGSFHLDVSVLAGVGVSCGSDADCGPGLDCNPAGSGSGSGSGSAALACAKPECSDGIDNNGDGKIDYPNDPSCTSPTDNSEVTVCPGANCPQCSDGKDNDGDGEIDYPADTSCLSAAGESEACSSVDPLLKLTGSDTSGTLEGATADFALACADTAGGVDQAYAVTFPKLATLSIEVDSDEFDFEPAVALLNSTCSADNAVDCSSFESLQETDLAAGQYFIVVADDDPDFDPSPTTYDLFVSGTVAAGQKCEGALFTSGVLTCDGANTCTGATGSKKCTPPQCSDGIDNNGDGKIDYPDDPGCSSPTDPTETTVCPGANCPVCSNGKDDDGDGKIDYPADFGCEAAGGTSELFCPADDDAATVIKTATTASTFVATHNDLLLDCGSSTGHDRSFALQLPVPVDSITIDTEGSTAVTTVLELWAAGCDNEVACDDGEVESDTEASVTATNVPAGNYAVSVQAYTGADNGRTFQVNVHGTVAKNVACTSALFTGANPALTCDAGLSCTAGKCQ